MEISNSHRFQRSLLACAVAAAFALSAGTAAAQDTKDKSSTAAATQTKRAEKDARESWERTHRASKIIGSEVRNAKDEKVGSVKDLVLAAPESGTISHVVVSVGGVAGLGDKLFAVPYDEVHHVAGKDYLVLDATSDLSKGFDDKSWPAETAWRDRSAPDAAASAPPASSRMSTSSSDSSPPATSASTSSSDASMSSSTSPASSAPPTSASTSSSDASTSSPTSPGSPSSTSAQTSMDSATSPATAPSPAQTPSGTPQ